MQMTDAKLARLDELLVATDRYSIEAVDGLFSAAIVGPVDTTVDACMRVFDIAGAKAWESDAQKGEAYALLHELWKLIEWRVSSSPDVLQDECLPFVDMPEELDELEDIADYDGDFPLASDWAMGFRFAISEWNTEWSAWMDDEYLKFFLTLVELSSDQLATESEDGEPDADAEADAPPSFAERMELLNVLPHSLHALYRRKHPAHGQPIRRDGAKPGRNDTCSCGSGKKYKKCCGAG